MAGDLVSRSRSGPPSSSHVVAFQEKLRETRSTCAWLDQQLETPSKSFNPARAARLIRRSSPQDAPSAKSATQEAVESATTQIVNRALRLLKKDNGSGAEGGEASHPPQTPNATSIGSKGLEAFSGVGRLVENLANTLDDVIGQAFKDWSTPLAYPPAAHAPASGRKGEGTSLARAMDSAWDDFQVADKDWEAVPPTSSRRRRAGSRRTMSPYLSRLGGSEDAEACAEKRAPGDAPTPVADDLAAEQVTEQMKTLLDEKARLAQENARLRLENEGLKELLAFTLAHQAELMGDHELFVEDDPVASEFPGRPVAERLETTPEASHAFALSPPPSA